MGLPSFPTSSAFHVWLLRHGNTFTAKDRVTWLGKTDDPPMVPDGVLQIQKVADYIRQTALIPRAAYCAPYHRTRHAAEILQKAFGDFPILDDARLCEMDYGDWNGLTNPEIEDRYGLEALRSWRDRGVTASDLGWTPSQQELKQDAAALLGELVERYGPGGGTILIVAPNSRLRYFLHAIEGVFEALSKRDGISIRTGHLGRLTFQQGLLAIDGMEQFSRFLS